MPGHRVATTLALATLLALILPAANAEPNPTESDDGNRWWEVRITDLMSNESHDLVFVAHRTESTFTEIGVTDPRDVGHVAVAFAFPLFPLGRVALPDIEYEVGDQSFNAYRYGAAEGDEWTTNWGQRTLVARVADTNDERTVIELRQPGSTRQFGSIIYDQRTAWIATFTIDGHASASVLRSGPGSNCASVLPSIIDDVPAQRSAPSATEAVPGTESSEVDVGPMYDHIAVFIMAGLNGDQGTARAVVTSPEGDIYQVTIAPGDAVRHKTLAALAMAPQGTWRTATAQTGAAFATISVIGIAFAEQAHPAGPGCQFLPESWTPDSPDASAGPFDGGEFGLVEAFAAVAVMAMMAGTAGLGIAAAIRRLPWARWWGAFYAKLTRDQVGNQEVRAGLLDAIRDQPGLLTQEIRRTAGIGWGAAVHHLNVLEEHGLVVSVSWGRNRHWLDASIPRARRAALVAERHPPVRRILRAVRDHPGITQKELADEVGLHRTTVYFHSKKLEGMGVVELRRAGNHVAFYVA